jgi:hypothetical protein
MADIIASIQEDDDSTTAVPHRRKRPMIESEPEDLFDVPSTIQHNPMAPATKKRRQLEDDAKLSRSNSRSLPLQPLSPNRVPPMPLRHKRQVPRHHVIPQSQLQSPPRHSQIQSQSQSALYAPQRQVVLSNSRSQRNKWNDEDDSMGEIDSRNGEDEANIPQVSQTREEQGQFSSFCKSLFT